MSPEENMVGAGAIKKFLPPYAMSGDEKSVPKV